MTIHKSRVGPSGSRAALAVRTSRLALRSQLQQFLGVEMGRLPSVDNCCGDVRREPAHATNSQEAHIGRSVVIRIIDQQFHFAIDARQLDWCR
jgi:hypothetical protein